MKMILEKYGTDIPHTESLVHRDSKCKETAELKGFIK